jgi:curved DNA-binding protein
MEFKDYYAILGVEKSASADELKRAYRRLAKLHHPDLQPEAKKAEAGAKFKEINEAYEVLSDPKKRAKYDALGPGWDQPGAGEAPPEPPRGGTSESAGFEDFSGFSDFFENLYGRGGGRRGGGRPAGPRRGQDVEAEMPLSLEDALQGGEKTLSLRVPALCPECGGTGRRGRGACPSCGGIGEAAREKTITARLPAGARDGTRLRLRGQGGAGPRGGEAGDLYLRVRLLPHPDFKVLGADLETAVRLMPWTAALGGEAEVPAPGGPVRIKIPAGTRAGKVFRLAGRGLASDGGGRGDLLAVARLDLPERDDERVRAAWRALKEAAQ